MYMIGNKRPSRPHGGRARLKQVVYGDDKCFMNRKKIDEWEFRNEED